MMRHGSGKSASNTGAEDSTRAADGCWANPATDTGGAGESANTKNDAKDGAGTRLSVSARAAQPPRRGSETRVGFRGVRRRKSGARSDPKTGLGGRSAPTAPSEPNPPEPEPKSALNAQNPVDSPSLPPYSYRISHAYRIGRDHAFGHGLSFIARAVRYSPPIPRNPQAHDRLEAGDCVRWQAPALEADSPARRKGFQGRY